MTTEMTNEMTKISKKHYHLRDDFVLTNFFLNDEMTSLWRKNDEGKWEDEKMTKWRRNDEKIVMTIVTLHHKWRWNDGENYDGISERW